MRVTCFIRWSKLNCVGQPYFALNLPTKTQFNKQKILCYLWSENLFRSNMYVSHHKAKFTTLCSDKLCEIFIDEQFKIDIYPAQIFTHAREKPGSRQLSLFINYMQELYGAYPSIVTEHGVVAINQTCLKSSSTNWHSHHLQWECCRSYEDETNTPRWTGWMCVERPDECCLDGHLTFLPHKIRCVALYNEKSLPSVKPRWHLRGYLQKVT